SYERNKDAQLTTRIVNFPVDLIDRFVAFSHPQLNGLFHSLLGNRLNLNLNKEPSEEGLAFNLSVSTPLMQGDMEGLISKEMVTLKKPSLFHLNVIPQDINSFINSHVELLEPSR